MNQSMLGVSHALNDLANPQPYQIVAMTVTMFRCTVAARFLRKLFSKAATFGLSGSVSLAFPEVLAMPDLVRFMN
jgi:hypothetical protein